MKSYILPIGIRITVPLVLGFIIFLITKETIYMQILFLLLAMVGLMSWLGNYNRLDRQNMKKNGTTKVDKTSTDYLDFRRNQRVVLYSSLLYIAMSYLIFLIFGG